MRGMTQVETPQRPPETWLQRLVGAPFFWISFVGIIAGGNILRAVLTELPETPPMLGQVPEFSFQDQSGADYGSDDLKDKIWVANFIFTRCTTVCPLFSAEMATLQKRTNKAAVALQLVSFSVDPDFDTPEVLNEYSKRYSANPWYWHFLTGPVKDIRNTVTEGLKTAMGEASDAATIQGTLFHGSHFVLMDGDMQIRGFYAVSEDETIDRLLTDVQLLINERPHH
jgi:protein SCO1/2